MKNLLSLLILTISISTGNLGNVLNINNKTNFNNNLKVTNGTDVPEGKYPWFCSVTVASSSINTTGTGGVLIAPNWVLTAAHITVNFYPELGSMGNAKVVFGLYDNINYDKRKLEIRTANKIFNWSGSHNLDMNNDISLIQLDKPINDINPIALYPNNNKPKPGTKTTVMGYGLITTPDKKISFPIHMQESEIPVLPDSIIKDPRWNIKDFNPKNELLAGIITGNKRINASIGDSGGPLIEKINGKYFDIGIVSHGPTNENYFVLEPAAYTYVGIYTDWINKIIENN